MLPIHMVVQVLERSIMDVPAGQPAFADPRYSSFALNADYFYPLPKLRSERKIAFVDGGSAEIVGAPNFAVGLTRLYFCVFKGDKRIEAVKIPQRIDFYTVCYAVPKGNQITYKTELVPVKEEWRKYLPDIADLELDSLDRTIMLGLQRAPINRVLEVARVFAEWRLSSFIVREQRLQTKASMQTKPMGLLCKRRYILLGSLKHQRFSLKQVSLSFQRFMYSLKVQE